jgi:sugar phosphate isomerase/epimerase
MERILLATFQQDISRHCDLAQAHGAGLELQVYGYDPDLLDRGWRDLLDQHKALLRDFAGELAIHGAFIDTSPGSQDQRVVAVTRQVDFWGPMAEEAAEREVVIALENMWEPEPDIIGDVLDQVDSPHLCACLDVGHFYLFSDYLPLERWIRQISHRLVYCHMNNHRGSYDEHLSLDIPGGVIDYARDVLPLLRALPNPPALVLEMDEIEYLESSLRYLGR